MQNLIQDTAKDEERRRKFLTPLERKREMNRGKRIVDEVVAVVVIFGLIWLISEMLKTPMRF